MPLLSKQQAVRFPITMRTTSKRLKRLKLRIMDLWDLCLIWSGRLLGKRATSKVKFDTIAALVKGITTLKPTWYELDREQFSALSNQIKALGVPSKFKNPVWHPYTGKEDPLSHIHNFEVQTDLQGIRDDSHCRVFLATLSESVQQWYLKLCLRSINSWETLKKSFYDQFSPSKNRPIEPNNLTKILSEDAKVIALTVGLTVMGPLWKDLKLKSVYTVQEFLDRVVDFIKLEKAFKKVRGVA
uniref:Retrotransposon gag domain-containing protein n=1 Tax=Cannabis sativa TaxID=3483 RepID=A0A803PDJ4_CANSA